MFEAYLNSVIINSSYLDTRKYPGRVKKSSNRLDDRQIVIRNISYQNNNSSTMSTIIIDKDFLINNTITNTIIKEVFETSPVKK